MVRNQLQERLEYTARRMRRVGCANVKLIVTPASVDEKNKSVHPGDIQYDKDHCQKDRIHGSRFCAECRKKHLAERTERVRQAPPKRVHYPRSKRKK